MKNFSSLSAREMYRANGAVTRAKLEALVDLSEVADDIYDLERGKVTAAAAVSMAVFNSALADLAAIEEKLKHPQAKEAVSSVLSRLAVVKIDLEGKLDDADKELAKLNAFLDSLEEAADKT